MSEHIYVGSGKRMERKDGKVDTWKPDTTKAKPADVEKSDTEAGEIGDLPF